MEKTNIKKEVNEIFQIVGEELNLTNNFTKDDYMKLPLEKKKIFDDMLEYEFNERRGLFRTDFQIAVDKLNKLIKKQYGIEKTINCVQDFLSFNSNINISNDSLGKKQKKSLFKRIKDKFSIKDINKDLLDYETELNPIPDFEELNNTKSNDDFVPPIPVFEKGKKTLPDFECEDKEVQQSVEKPITENIIPDFDDSLDEKANNNREQLEQVKTKISNIKQEGDELSKQLFALRKNMILEDNELPDIPDFVEKEPSIIEEEKVEKLPEGTFDGNQHKPKHLKKENESSKEDIKKKILEDIRSCENMITILQYKTILPESEEQRKYVKEKIKIYKNKLRRLKEQQKKQDLSNFDYQFAVRRKKLESKLNKLERNDTNKKLISDIEIAISQIDSYMKYSDAYKAGIITENELTTKGNNTYMVVDYVLNERTRRSRK